MFHYYIIMLSMINPDWPQKYKHLLRKYQTFRKKQENKSMFQNYTRHLPKRIQSFRKQMIFLVWMRFYSNNKNKKTNKNNNLQNKQIHFLSFSGFDFSNKSFLKFIDCLSFEMNVIIIFVFIFDFMIFL